MSIASLQGKPAFKWVGSKAGIVRKLAPRLSDMAKCSVYGQPFFGGGSPYFQLGEGKRAYLSDSNPILVSTYKTIRDDPEDLIASLQETQRFYCQDYYYATRSELNSVIAGVRFVSRATVARLFLVILKWGFNGLWRVNRKGECNVPMGRSATGKPPLLCNAETIRACSLALRNASIVCEDFVDTMRCVPSGGFIYIDPPYAPASATANFVGYTAGGFSYAPGGDHDRLLAALHHLDSHGVSWALSNADTPGMRAAYAGWKAHEIRARRSLNCKGAKRGAVGELLVRGKVRL